MQSQPQFGGQIPPPPPPTPPASRAAGGRTGTVLGTIALILSAVAIVVSFAIPGPAGANGLNGTNGDTGAMGPQGPPGANATSLWAVVYANGTVARGSGVNFAGTASRLLMAGEYSVLFQNHNVMDCAYFATLGSAEAGLIAAPGFITAQLGNYANEANVTTYSVTGVPIDQSFSLAVLC